VSLGDGTDEVFDGVVLDDALSEADGAGDVDSVGVEGACVLGTVDGS
jgi:hypothetical protein